MDISILSNPEIIKSAKNQLVGGITNKVKRTVLTKAEYLNNELSDLKDKNQKIQKDYSEKIKNIQNNNTLSKEEKDKKINDLNLSKKEETKIIDEQIQKLKDDISNISNDVLNVAKKDKKKIDNTINKSILKSKSNSTKSNTLRIKQVLGNNKKSLVPIIINQLTNILVKIIEQNGKINELIDKTNNVIDNADTEGKIKEAIIMKNSTISLINNQEEKILSLQKTLKTISTIIQIFSVLLTILSALPIPVSTPPGVGIPLNIITNISKLIEKLNTLINELSTVLAIMIPTTIKIVNDLEELKLQLHDITNILDNKIENSPDIYNSIISNFNILNTNNFEEYKGFKFAIKEDENLGSHNEISFRGIKRHYAVAIDHNGTEVLQSEYSFTLDPNDLIEQLKIIIDKQNLQS